MTYKIVSIKFVKFKNNSYICINQTTKTMANTTMTRKEAATIMKKYEKNGMIGLKVKQEYFIAKQRWNEIVKETKK